eukprot:4668995-Pyramimonas_sp.AAC.1
MYSAGSRFAGGEPSWGPPRAARVHQAQQSAEVGRARRDPKLRPCPGSNGADWGSLENHRRLRAR